MRRTIIRLCSLLVASMLLVGTLCACENNNGNGGNTMAPTTEPTASQSVAETPGPKQKAKAEEVKNTYQGYLSDLNSFPVCFTYDNNNYKGFGNDYTEIERNITRKDKSELTVIKLNHSDGKLQVTIEAEYYPDYNAYEWTVWYENIGDEKTPILSKVNSAEVEFNGKNPILKGINGDAGTLNSHYEKDLTKLKKVNVTSASGRPTHVTFPYYNLEYGEGGVLLSIGWAGCSRVDFETNGDKTSFSAGLYDFESYLNPGEKIRTPLMSFVFYTGRDENDAMNVWRRWFIDCNMPKEATGEAYQPKFIYHPGRMTNLMINASEGKFKILINKMEEHGLRYDILHMDAGWYTDVEGNAIKTWLQTGSWEVNKTKFPTSFASLTELGKEYEYTTGLWFEPEWFRLDVDTFVKNNPDFNKDWLIYLDAQLNSAAGAPWYLLNLGNEDAFNWIFDKMCSVVDASGITLLKMDFNADPGPSWRYQDELIGPNRKGITENLYVQAYYKLYESFHEKYPNFMIGSCASGGGRNDLETMRLAVVMNSTDYDADNSEVKQGMSWSLAQWIPYHDMLTRQGGSPKVDLIDLYDARSNYAPSVLTAYDLSKKDFDWDSFTFVINEWNSIKKYFYSDYYTLTPWSNNKTDWKGWMFFDKDEQGGFIQMFRPENSTESNKKVKLYGLDANATYTITDPDGINSTTATGAALMNDGISYNMPEARYASLLYIAKTNA